MSESEKGPMQPTGPKVSIFISYAHADHELHKKLEEHLSSLKHSGEITIWQDQEIPAGADWENQIDTHLNTADIILLLISASFITSKYRWNKEVPAALERHQAGTARVIPIILRPVNWEDTPLKQLQALPTGAKPVTLWNDQDEAFANVVRGIRKVVKGLSRALQEKAQQEETMGREEATSLQPPIHTVSQQESAPDLSSIRPSPQRNVPPSSQPLTLPLSRRQLIAPLILVLVGAGIFSIYTTTTGKWGTSQGQPTPDHSQNLEGIAWSGSRFVIVGTNGTILTSPDGISWTSRPSGTTRDLHGIVWSRSQFVVVGGSGTILSSPDGISWTSRTVDPSQNLEGIAWSDSQFAVVGGSGTILSSPDGISWTLHPSGTPHTLYSIAWSDSQFVAVGESGTILSSLDGISWTSRTAGSSQDHFCGIAWSGTQFVTVGEHGTILSSPDGISWTPRTVDPSHALYSIAWSGTQFVTVGESGTILSSPDGISWTPHSPRTAQALYSIAWSDPQFVTVGRDGTILTGF